MSTNNGIEAVLAAWTKQALISSFEVYQPKSMFLLLRLMMKSLEIFNAI